MPSEAEIDALIERLKDVAGFVQKEHGRVAAASCLATEAAAFLVALRNERNEAERSLSQADEDERYRIDVSEALGIEQKENAMLEARVRELEQKLERARGELTDVTACVENRKAIYEALLEKASVWAEPEYMRWDMLKYVVAAFEILEKEISPALTTLAEIGQRG